jgi:hypothetical protein
MRFSIVLAIAAALALSVPGLAAAKPHGRPCGMTGRIDGQFYAVYEEQGHAACRTIKPTLVRYLRTSKFSRPWFCALAHGSQFEWAASCAKGHVVVRAYARNE